jgi:hypothetical protein
MSGRSNIIWWLEKNSFEPTEELVAHLFEVAKSKRRLMSDNEVKEVVSTFISN